MAGSSFQSRGEVPDTKDVMPSSPCWIYRSDNDIVSAGSDNSYVYIVKEGARLEALSITTGERIWTAEYGGEVFSNLVVGTNQLFVATANSGPQKSKSVVRSISSATGITNWISNLDISGPMTLGISGNNLVVASVGGKFVTLRGTDGVKTLEKSFDSSLYAKPVIAESRIALATSDKRIRIVSTVGFSDVLNLSVTQEPTSIAMDGAAVYWGDERGNVYAYDIGDADYRWQLKQGGKIIGLVPTNEGIAFASADNFVYLASASYGNIRWKRRLSNRITSLTNWNSEFFIVLDASGEQAYVLEEKKGRIVNQVPPSDSQLFSILPSVSGNLAMLFSPRAAHAYRIGGCIHK